MFLVSSSPSVLILVPGGSELIDEINKFVPSEIIVNEYFAMSGINLDTVNTKLGIAMSTLDNWYFNEETCKKRLLEHFHMEMLDGLGLKDYTVGIIASGALLTYLYETQKSNMPHITTLLPYSSGKYMLIDSSSRRNLELVETMREKQKKGSLLWVLDKTKTAMGARMLRSYIDSIKINATHREVFINNYLRWHELINLIYKLTSTG